MFCRSHSLSLALSRSLALSLFCSLALSLSRSLSRALSLSALSPALSLPRALCDNDEGLLGKRACAAVLEALQSSS